MATAGDLFNNWKIWKIYLYVKCSLLSLTCDNLYEK